jgi:hypothetical protein
VAALTHILRGKKRRTLVAGVDRTSDRMYEWLKSLGGPPYEREASSFFWLLEAVEEMRAR